jgi:heterodisulfide reductase subunit A
VAQGGAAAANILSLLDRGSVVIEPITSVVEETTCGGCRICISVCPYHAASFDEAKGISVVDEAACKGCGTCAAACPSGAARQRFFDDRNILAEIGGLLASPQGRL